MSSPIDITPACECGALLHSGETCEAALACLEAMLAGCTCGGQAVAKTLHEAERTERAAMRMCKGEAQAVHLAAAQRHADTRRALLLVLDLLDAIGGAS